MTKQLTELSESYEQELLTTVFLSANDAVLFISEATLIS